jgi:hypothetical protein
LLSKYGLEGLDLSSGKIEGSLWWRDILKLFSVKLGKSAWMHSNLISKLEDGCKTSFWHDNWLGDGAMCLKYRKLYKVAINKQARVSELG